MVDKAYGWLPRKHTRRLGDIVDLDWSFGWSWSVLDNNLKDSLVFSDFILQVELIVSRVGTPSSGEEDACLSNFDVNNELWGQTSNSLHLPVDLRLGCTDAKQFLSILTRITLTNQYPESLCCQL